MKGVLKEAGCAALKVWHQDYHCLETDSMAAIHGVDPRNWIVWVKYRGHWSWSKYSTELDQEQPNWTVLEETHRVHQRSGIRVGGISEASCCDHQKPFQDGREATELSDPEELDELEEVEGKLYQQDTGISIYVSSRRSDIQFCVKRLSEMMTKPRKLVNLRLARLARHLVGTQKLVLSFDHQEHGDTENCRRPRSGWKRGTLFHARRAGILWRTSRGFVGCIRSSASIEFRRSRALRNRESSQSTCTRRWAEPSTLTSKRARRLRSGCVPERALERPVNRIPPDTAIHEQMATQKDKWLRKSVYNDKYTFNTFETTVDNHKSDATHINMRIMQN